MIFSPYVVTILLLESVTFLFAVIAFGIALQITRRWDFHASDAYQYELEKKSVLAATIVKYVLLTKIALFIFYIYTLDDLSNIITGAMCAAGVVNASLAGSLLLALKIVDLYLFGYWIALDKKDLSFETLPFTKRKFFLFLFLFVAIATETFLSFRFFSSLHPQMMVSCCSTLYSQESKNAFFSLQNIDTLWLRIFFVGSYIIVVLGFFIRSRVFFTIGNFFFLATTIASVIYYFSPYIYELPTHRCPFCLLQKEYDYVGYFFYTFLFLGTFYGFLVGFLEARAKYYKISLFFNTLVLLSLWSFVLAYYVRNGAWLFS